MGEAAEPALVRTETGVDLRLVREISRPIEDVWSGVTEPARTAEWFGPWRGDARPGATIEVQMSFEDGEPWSEMVISQCTAPTLLAVDSAPGSGGWQLELRLSEVAGGTRVDFIHHLLSTEGVGDIGPGWEFYLDLLVGTFTGAPKRAFEEYYPSMSASYEALVARSTSPES